MIRMIAVGHQAVGSAARAMRPLKFLQELNSDTREITMKRSTKLAGTLVALTAMAGCSTSLVHPHEALVSRRILQQSDRTVMVDLRPGDHVAIGDELIVYRKTLVGNPKQIPYFSDVVSGSIRIDEFLGSHLARGTLISGAASDGELVKSRQAQ
jgi:hypothetical protein